MGNLGCGCSEFQTDGDIPENLFNSDFEEVIEFQPGMLKSSTKINVNPQIFADSKRSTFDCDTVNMEIEGEMNRIQKGIREISIPRWCSLSTKSFKYFKNEFSAMCKEKPLFELNIDKIFTGKAYKRRGKYYIEFSYSKPLFCSIILPGNESKYSYKSYSEANSKKQSHNSSFSSVKPSKNIGKPENAYETLLFSVSEREEWDKWSKAIQICVRSND